MAADCGCGGTCRLCRGIIGGVIFSHASVIMRAGGGPVEKTDPETQKKKKKTKTK